jgi:acetyltransferase-like isoleucine patch superfamily enzyme
MAKSFYCYKYSSLGGVVEVMVRKRLDARTVDRMRSTFERRRAIASEVMIRKWDRCLPLDETLGDRWKKAAALKFGERTSVYENSYVYGKPTVGKGVWIGPYTILDATGGLEIGDGTEISCGVMIFSHSTHLRTVSEGQIGVVRKPVKIGRHVYVGSSAVILPGVTLGDHSIIGAGAVVTSNVDEGKVAFGVPARVVGQVKGNGASVVIEYAD